MLVHIFKYEWLSLVKNRLFIGVFSFSLLLCFLALWSGYQSYQSQAKVIEEIQNYEKEYYEKLTTQLSDIEANGFKGNSFADPTKPTSLAFNKGFRFAYRTPFFMQILNIGQSDLHPYYYKVTASKQQALYHSGEIKNGMLSFVGVYDLSFVVIYLLPLLIIAFSFDMLAGERENGTLPYLYSAQWTLSSLLLGRYAFRTLLFFGSIWLLTTLFLGIALSSFSFLGYPQFWFWALAVFIYTAFWFALSFLVNSFGKSPNYNATVLVFTWLAAVVFLPSILQYTTATFYPTPSRSDLITESREAGIEAQKKSAALLDDYIQDHPELAANKEGLNLTDFGTKYFVQLEEVEKVTQPTIAVFAQKQAERDAFIRRLSLFSPALLGQELLNELSATSNHHYQYLEADAKNIQQDLRKLFVQRIFLNQSFKPKDLSLLPVFRTNDSYYVPTSTWITAGFSFLLFLILIALFSGFYVFKRGYLLAFKER